MYDGYLWKEHFTKEFDDWFYTKWEHDVVNSTIYLTYGIYDKDNLLWHRNRVQMKVTAYKPLKDTKYKIKLTVGITSVFVVGYSMGWTIRHLKK